MWPFDKNKAGASQQIQDPMDQVGGYGGFGGLPGMYIGNGSGHIHIGSGAAGGGGGSGSSQSSLSQMLKGLGIYGLSKEEREELERLKAEHKSDCKALRVAEFKKIPSELRQFVINASEWQEAVRRINLVSVPQSERFSELSIKEDNGTFKHQSMGGFGVFGGYPVPGIALPEGITIQELKDAHVEQTIEEEMLNE